MATATAAEGMLHYNDPDHNVIKLKFEDSEKFCELVISHLTRFLDLPGAELDILRGDSLSINKENVNKVHHTGIKLWNPLRKKDSKNVGCSLSDDNLNQIQQLTDFLVNNLTVEGLFRKPGNSSRQNQLQLALSTGANINFEKSQFHPHDAATVLKSILGQLSEPLLLPSQHFDAHVQISKMNKIDPVTSKLIPDKGKRIESLQLLLLLLPTNHRKVLRAVFNLLLQTAKYQKENKMNAANLATVFTPRLICQRTAKAADIHSNVSDLNDHIAFMIRHCEKIFVAPPYIRQSANYLFPASNIPASPKISASVLVAPSSAVKRTASERKRYEDSTKIQTENAISELYNQVTSLPSSSKKKKLVKNFSKHEEVIKYHNKPRKRHRTLSGFMKKRTSHKRSESQSVSLSKSEESLLDGSNNGKNSNQHSQKEKHDLVKKSSHASLTDRIIRSVQKDSPKSPLLTGISKRLQNLQSKSLGSPSSVEKYSKPRSPSISQKITKVSAI